ncbi:hypothetical protein [Rhodococcoides fascians]|uniref:hypothetical protein n=1 Tax=Rhodococcoides fascians TaxID=1828 RepID=UPI00068E0F9E|nr:hypothetical protein [Rhodococcus fascians]
MTGNELALAAPPQSLGRAPITAKSITGDLEQQVLQMDLAYRLAQDLCKTALCPTTFRGKPEDGAVAIMAGAKWGLDAITSLQNIFVVHGSPSTYARVMKAITLAHGHKIWVVESSGTSVLLAGLRDGDSEDRVEHVEWTIERARAAGYFTNSKYETEPENMLYARATAEMCRRLAPDALLGMPYSREELVDDAMVKAYAKRLDGAEGDDRLRVALEEDHVSSTETPIPPDPDAEQSAQQESQDEAPATAEEKPATGAVMDVESIIAAIAVVKTVKDLQELWTEHRNNLGEHRGRVYELVTAKLEQIREADAQAEADAAVQQPLDAETVPDGASEGGEVSALFDQAAN